MRARGTRPGRTTPPRPVTVDAWDDDGHRAGDPPSGSHAGRILRALRARPGVYGRVGTAVNLVSWMTSDEGAALAWLVRRGFVEHELRRSYWARTDVWARTLPDSNRRTP
jgi:hypothetical protein